MIHLKIDESSLNSIEVQAYTLSDFCINKRIKSIDLLKIDIEGGEYDVFEFDFQFIKSNVKFILMEINNIDNNKNMNYIINKLDPFFHIKIESEHAGGGVITGFKKTLN